MQTSADDGAVLDRLESDLMAVEVALAELDRLGEIGSDAPVGDGSSDRASAVRAVMADPRFGMQVTEAAVSDDLVSSDPVSDDLVSGEAASEAMVAHEAPGEDPVSEHPGP